MSHLDMLERMQAQAFEYWAGHLSPDERRAIEEALITHPALADHYARVRHLLDDVERDVESQWTPQRADRVWARIQSAVTGEDEAASGPWETGAFQTEDVVRIAYETEMVEAAPPRRSRLPRWGGLGAVAAAALLTWVWLSSGTSEDPAPSGAIAGAVAEATAPTAEEQSPTLEANPDVEVIATLAERVASMRSSSASFSGAIWVSEDAVWSVESSATTRTLRVEAGTVLVEYVPRDERGLAVEARDLRARVVGTVFLVDVEDEASRLAVFEGAVEVQRPGTAERLVSRNELDEGALVAVSMPLREAADAHVDLAGHREALDAARAERASQPASLGTGADAAPSARAALPVARARAASRAARPVPEPVAAPEATRPEADAPGETEALALASEIASAPAAPTPRRPAAERPPTRRAQPAAQPEAAPDTPAQSGDIDPFRARGGTLLDDDAVALNRARAMGDHEEAARRLESLIASHRGLDAEARYRLELAQLYSRQLQRPSDAAPHWRALLNLELDPGTASFVERSLCALGMDADRRRCR